MNPPKFVLASALVIPALLFLSCKDVNENPVAPNTPGVGSPGSQGGYGYDPSKLKFPPVSDADLALAVREDAEAEAAEAAILSATTTSDALSPHDPRGAMLVLCLNGHELNSSIPNGTATRFRNSRGCELSTHDNDTDPSNNAAFIRTVQNLVSGKLLTRVTQLDFYYAGDRGDHGTSVGSNPHWNVPIDECEPTSGVPTSTCPPGQSTDGFTDGTTYIDVVGCNDGDPNVGVLRAEDDPTCNVFYRGVDYPNWTAFEAAFPGARIASKDFVPFITQSWEHQHYLIYRVSVR